jgi:hypothetical membrane protein
MRPEKIQVSGKTPVSQWGILLLTCGIIASLLYIAMNIIIPMFYPGYSPVSRVVSELSAIGAPTRTIWVVPAILYSLLVAAFGWGIRLSAGKSRFLQILGTLMILSGLIGLAWTPMHRREILAAGGGSFTDTWHIVMTFITLVLMLAMIGFGAAAMKRSFRIYSVLTVVVFMVFGILTWLASPGISTNLPTPMIGVWERINIGAYMLWMIVLAVHLLKRTKSTGIRISAPGESFQGKIKSNGQPQSRVKHTM